VTDKGALVTLVVPIKIAAPHYTHASVPAGESYEPTKIEIELPEGARWHGEWQTPETFAGARPGAAPYQAHRGDAIFTRQLYFTRVPTEGRDLAGRALVTIRGVVRYQACYQAPDDTTECLSPREAPVETKLIVAER
jgi:hypothetical protein